MLKKWNFACISLSSNAALSVWQLFEDGRFDLGKECQKEDNLSRSSHTSFKQIVTVLFSTQLKAITTEHLDIKSVELNIKQNQRVKTS